MIKARKLWGLALIALVALVAVVTLKAQQATPTLTGTEAMIPMRDGVRLYTQIYTPTNASEKLPILLLRTPYGAGPFNPQRIAAALPELMAGWLHRRLARHSRAVQIEGPVRHAPATARPQRQEAIDESTDTL
jgi:predicted acyl esterase